MGKKKKDNGVLLTYNTKHELQLNCTILDALGACYAILSVVSEQTGIPYNELVRDLQEVDSDTTKENCNE